MEEIVTQVNVELEEENKEGGFSVTLEEKLCR